MTHVVSAQGGRTVYIAGQVARSKDGQVVGVGDFEAQAVKVFENLASCLAVAGAQVDDIVKVSTYVVNYKPELRPVIAEARRKVFGDNPPNGAGTMVGVQALSQPEFLIEVEAFAVIGAE